MSLQASQSTSRTRTDVPAAIAAALPCIDPRPVIVTVAQFAERNPAFTPPALRNLIFRSQPRRSSRGQVLGNGLAESGAIIRLGRRVLLDEAKFLDWVMAHGEAR